MIDKSTATSRRQVAADARTVDDAFRLATRTLGAPVANGYVTQLARKNAVGTGEVDLIEARAQVAALMRLNGVLSVVEDHADNLTKQWLGTHRVAVLGLSEERQATYGLIRAQAREPEHQDTKIPDLIQEESRDEDGQAFETRPLHVLADGNGRFPIGSLSTTWERAVVDTELARPNVAAWYRNPAHSTGHAIRVPYKVGDDWKSLQPDFVFVSRSADGKLAASIVDPHGTHLADALPKLRGLAEFAERYAGRHQRVDSLAKNAAGDIVALDMLDASTRGAVRASSDAASLFDSHAIPYS